MKPIDKKDWPTTGVSIQNGEEKPRAATFKGRVLWAAKALAAAGDKGCTPIDTPGPRWSGYVHKLRNAGVVIDTISEPHDGPFAGSHARYVLRSKLIWSDVNEGGAS